LIANVLGSHEAPWAVAVFSGTSTRQDVVRRTRTVLPLAFRREIERGKPVTEMRRTHGGSRLWTV
jgi:hypothetical protein